MVAPSPSTSTAASTGTGVHSRRRPWLAIAAAAAVSAVVIGLAAHSDGPTRAPGPFPPAFPAATAPDVVDLAAPIALPPQTHARPPKLEKKWRDALRKLERGELDAAAEKAAQVLRDDPDDAQARALLDELVRRGARPEDDD